LEQKNKNQVNHSRFWDIPPPITQNQHHDNVLSKDAYTTQPQPQNHPPPSHPITKFKRSKTPLSPDHSGRGQISCLNTIFCPLLLTLKPVDLVVKVRDTGYMLADGRNLYAEQLGKSLLRQPEILRLK
jgi:hypothetical protein